ncbi:MAG: peptidoglycan bridge formation glycyltransferase FemA/FemB family protein [Fimbriimonadaceae bacterium]|nr:peptidoglycan bridge formation glycyltransferase FemA/FemB family protein [Fimbriimonadaceae bacterium]
MSETLVGRWLVAADAAAYDSFVGQHPLNDFAQAWAWGELKGRGEWTPHRYGVFAGEHLVAAAQLLLRRLPAGYTLAYISRGPIVDLVGPAAQPWRTALFSGLQQFAQAQRAICLKLDPCLPATEPHQLTACGCRPTPGLDGRFGGTQPRYVMRLDLTPGLDQVFADFKPDYRNRIRKSEKRGVTVRLGTPADLPGFYRLLTETAARQHFAVRGPAYFEGLLADCQGACQAALLLAEREDRLVGGILCLGYGDTTWYLYGGMNDEGREHYSGYRLQWEAMQWAVARGCRTYDFRGVAPPTAEDSPLYGLNRFKGGFGPELVEWVGEWDLVLRPLPYHAFTSLLPKLKALRKRFR